MTVAGNYNNDMAPDVDLRLSFPSKIGAPQAQLVPNLNSNWRKRSSANPANKWGPQAHSSPLSPNNGFFKAQAALPPSKDSFNSKRNLIPGKETLRLSYFLPNHIFFYRSQTKWELAT